MKDIFEGNPSISVKRKHVQAVIDHCLEKKIEIIVKPSANNEEWLIEFNIVNVKKAVLLGMFLREVKLDLTDISYKNEKIVKSEPAKTNPVISNKLEIKEASANELAPSFSFGEEAVQE